MFTVKECLQPETALSLCARLGAPAKPGDRIFVLREDGEKAVGLLGLRHGKVIVKGVWGDVDDAYRDVLNRTLLHVCRCMNPIPVRVEQISAYWKQFGFEEKDGGMEILSTDITFCAGHAQT